MATLDTIDGKSLTIRIVTATVATAIQNLTSNSLSDTTDMSEVTTKNSGTHKEYKPKYQDKTISFEGLLHHTAATAGYEDLRAAKTAKTLIDWEWGTGVSGTPKLSGKGYIVSLEEDAADGEDATFSGEIQNTGDPVEGSYV
jgi:hypothetical protein